MLPPTVSKQDLIELRLELRHLSYELAECNFDTHRSRLAELGCLLMDLAGVDYHIDDSPTLPVLSLEVVQPAVVVEGGAA